MQSKLPQPTGRLTAELATAVKADRNNHLADPVGRNPVMSETGSSHLEAPAEPVCDGMQVFDELRWSVDVEVTAQPQDRQCQPVERVGVANPPAAFLALRGERAVGHDVGEQRPGLPHRKVQRGKVRQSSRSRSKATRYHRRLAATSCTGSTCRCWTWASRPE